MKLDRTKPDKILSAEITTDINRDEIDRRIAFLVRNGVRNPFNGIPYRYACARRSGRLQLCRIGGLRSIYPAIDVLIENAGVGCHISLRCSVQAALAPVLAILIYMGSPIMILLVVAILIGKSYVTALLVPLFIGAFIVLWFFSLRLSLVDAFKQDVRLLRWFLSTEHPY